MNGGWAGFAPLILTAPPASQLAALAVVGIASAFYFLYNPGGGSSGSGKGFTAESRVMRLGQGAMKGLALASPVTAAGGNLFRQACLTQQAGDVVISPISVVVAMSLAAAGATEGHQAGKEIREAMGHGLVKEGSDEASVHAYFKALLSGMHESDKRVWARHTH